MSTSDNDADSMPEIKAHLITTAVSLPPNQWAILHRERLRRGKGTTISSLIREAIFEKYGAEAKDDVAPQGSYDRTKRRGRDEE